jgi:hypothetical protein
MLVFMLAVMLPAAALIVASVSYLRHIQRSKAIDAAIQRDYQQTLAIAGKQIVERAYEISEEARSKFPDVDGSDELDSFLTTHPEISHAFLWTGKGSLDFRSQRGRMTDPDFQAESKRLSSEFGHWFDMESDDQIAKVERVEAVEGHRVFITPEWVPRGDKMQYESFVYFVPRGSTPEHPALTGFAYDEDYLRNGFFPQALNEVLPNQNPNDTSHPQSGIMIRKAKSRLLWQLRFAEMGGRPKWNVASIVFSRA